MASRPVTPGEPIAPFVPDLEALIAEVMDEWKIPGLAIAVVQNGEVALVKAYGLRDVEAGLKVTTDTQFHDLLDHEVVHLHGLGPFGGRAAPGLEEAGARLHPGIPPARCRCDRPHYGARFALPSFRPAAPRLDLDAWRSVTRANAGGDALFGTERRHSQHLPIPEPRLSRRRHGGRAHQRSELDRLYPCAADRQAAHDCDFHRGGFRRSRRCGRALRDGRGYPPARQALADQRDGLRAASTPRLRASRTGFAFISTRASSRDNGCCHRA